MTSPRRSFHCFILIIARFGYFRREQLSFFLYRYSSNIENLHLLISFSDLIIIVRYNTSFTTIKAAGRGRIRSKFLYAYLFVYNCTIVYFP